MKHVEPNLVGGYGYELIDAVYPTAPGTPYHFEEYYDPFEGLELPTPPQSPPASLADRGGPGGAGDESIKQNYPKWWLLKPAERLVLEAGGDLEAFRLANYYIDAVIQRESLLAEISDLQATLDKGYTKGIFSNVPIDKADYQKKIHELTLRATALGFEVAAHRNRLISDYGNLEVPAMGWWTYGESRVGMPAGTGPKALIELAIALRGYSGRIAGVESVGGGPIDLFAFGVAGKLHSLAAMEFAMPTKVTPSVVRFFYDPRSYDKIRREYWKGVAANGRSLHHWLFPRRATWVPLGIRNAGFNLVELPSLRGIFHPTLDLNTWMGFATTWGGSRALKAGAVEWGIRLAIPGSLIGGGYLGGVAGDYFFGQDGEQ